MTQRQATKRTGNGIRVVDQVYASLKARIIRMEWQPGERVNDEETAKTEQVSRLSVRAALDRLVQDDILEQRQWKGYFLRSISKQEVIHLTDVRLVLEELALREVCRLDDSELRSVCSLLDESICIAEKELETGTHASFLEKSFGFHETIYRASGNPIIGQLMDNVIIKLNIMRNLSMGKGDVDFRQAGQRSIVDHKTINNALKRRDAALCCSLLNVHLSKTFVDNTFKSLES